MLEGYAAIVANVFGDVAQMNQLNQVHSIGVTVTLVENQVTTVVTLLTVPVTQIKFPQSKCRSVTVKPPPLRASM